MVTVAESPEAEAARPELECQGEEKSRVARGVETYWSRSGCP